MSDFGAKVIRVDKTGHGLNYDVTARGKRSIALNLKKEEGADILRNNITTFHYFDFLQTMIFCLQSSPYGVYV